MNGFFIYLKIEIKRAWKILPHFLTGAVVLALLLGTIAFLAGKTLYGDKAFETIKVGVILPANDALSKQALSMLGSMDSVQSSCEFVYMEKEEGENLLKSGGIYALMIVPERFVEGIMTGENTPVTIILPENAGPEGIVFRELTKAGADILGTAQAAIYGTDEFLNNNNLQELIPHAEAELNRIFLSYALPRKDIFKFNTVSAVGDISVTEYYAVSAIVLFLILCGIMFSGILSPLPVTFRQKLKIIGIGSFKIISARITAVAIFLEILAAAVMAAAVSAGVIDFKIFMLWNSILLMLCISSFIVFIYEASGSAVTGVMCLFTVTVVMAFISGAFIPEVFLPESLKNISQFLPFKWMTESMRMFITGEFSMTSVFKTAALTCLLTAAGAVRRHRG